ncbi:LPXTG cell wall anchor domain-containing protein [Streptococcus sp. ACC21]|uniref:LPXTG cell wall anchor domain-containing protein n=1 Tax=Streptococcus sp. ACC21 TaxID=1161413 RepID=UPI000448E592|nr:LPXTG cell wall anchor domain-containing protein [Streptococcus sp. ACC21]EUB12502.1 LPXTG cell wall anchor domain protein [Streptococcus sp. ACC21]
MNQETKQIFSIRKFKTGTHSALLVKYGIVLAAATVLMGAATVSADETTATSAQPATEMVAPAVPKVATPENTPVQVQSEVKSDIPTAVPANATQEQAVKAVDGAQATLKNSVSSAKEAGVAVKEGDTKEVVINDGNASEKTSEVLTDLNKQDQAVKEAQAKQEANQKAYEETSANREKAVKDGQSSLSASTKEVDQLMEQAKKAGLLVTETTTDKTPNYKETKGLTGDALRKAMAENVTLYKAAIEAGIALQNKSVEDLKQTLALYQANQKAYTQANTAHKDAKSAGVADLELANGRQNQVVDLAKKNGVAIATKTETTSPTYAPVAGLEGDALVKAIEENIAKYKKVVADAVGKEDKSTNDAKAKLEAYLKELADYNAGKGTQSGIKWAGNTTVEAGTAQKMTGNEPAVSWGNLKTAAADAIQSLDRNQNTDANFDNLFKINGSGTVIIKNTTNGDVTLKISNINAWTAENTYLAVWGAKDGGIAWGVFATTHGTVSAGAGEGATGGNIGATGAILAAVKSYDYEVSTNKEVSTVTFNDIDNNQTVTLNGLDGSKLVKGRNINQAGNSYSAGAGDVSQASGGVIDSNGVQFNFDTARKVTFSGSHYLPGYINTSIVAGIFGVASEVPKEPKKPNLEVTKTDVAVPEAPQAPKPIPVAVKKATVEAPKAGDKPVPPTVAVEKVTVTAPDAPEAPKPVEVDVHYYKMTTTPTPKAPAPKTSASVTPASVLPSTGEEGSMLAVLGGALLTGLSLVGLRKRKEN